MSLYPSLVRLEQTRKDTGFSLVDETKCRETSLKPVSL